MKGPTVKERLAAAQNATTLMQLALAADADRAGFDLQEVFDALVPQADMISSELYWIKKALAEAVLNALAPTDDERIAAENEEEREGSCAMTAGEIDLVRVYRSLDIEGQQLLLRVGARLLIRLAMPALTACDPGRGSG
jgi:hypothetical protein